MEIIKGQRLNGERALFSSEGLHIFDTIFEDGESPLKECRGIRLDGCEFRWYYPLWYCDGVSARKTRLCEGARAGIWYTKNITLNDCTIDAPKTLRRSSNILLKSCRFPNAEETLWFCKDVNMYDVSVEGDYFGMNCIGVSADRLEINGKYAFDGALNVIIRNSRIISKDVFWNAENIEVYDSLIVGEYLGWNSKSVKLVNCTIQSHQGMCYMDGVTLVNCKVIDTDLAFEYSRVNADITTRITSVKNPTSGRISAMGYDEIIMEPERVDVSATEIVVKAADED